MTLSRKWLEIYILGIWSLSILADPLPVLSLLPIEIFEPVGALHFLPTTAKHFIATEIFLRSLKISTLLFLFWAMAGRRLWPAGIAVSVLLTVYQGIVRGYADINHDHVPLLYGVYLLTLFSLADEIVRKQDPSKFATLKPDLDRLAWISIPAIMLICFSFLGAYRFVYGGIDLFTSDTLKMWIFRNAHRAGYIVWWDPTLLLAKQPWIYTCLKAGFPAVTMMEFLAPLCLFYKPLRWAFLSVMIPFFILNTFVMNICFWQNFLICLLIFIVTRPVHSAKV